MPSGQPGHPDIVSPCPLLRQHDVQVNIEILNDQERAYLEQLEIPDLDIIQRTLTTLAHQITATGPTPTPHIKIRSDKPALISPLSRILTNITNPLTIGGDYYKTCALFIEELAALVQRIKTQKASTKITKTTDQAQAAEIEEATDAMQKASQTLQTAGISLPPKNDNLAINRYGLACVFLIMKIYTIETIVQRNLAAKGTPLPTTFTPIDDAIENLAKLIQINPFHLYIALRLKQIGPTDSYQELSTKAANAIYRLLAVK